MYDSIAIQDSEYEQTEAGGSEVLLSAKEAVSLWLLGARKVCILLLPLNVYKLNCFNPNQKL